MKSTRAKKLTLSRETVTRLATADLTRIAGGFVVKNTEFPDCPYWTFGYSIDSSC
jgi:hypothetical protein